MIAYQIRLSSDLLPWIQLRIPYVSFWDLSIFSIVSAIVFILIWFAKNLYDLYDKLRLWVLIETYSLRFIVTIVIAYFWNWFIRQDWLSRIILILSAVWIAFFLLVIDRVLPLTNAKKRALIIGWSPLDEELFDEYECTHSHEYVSGYQIVIVVWEISQSQNLRYVQHVTNKWWQLIQLIDRTITIPHVSVDVHETWGLQFLYYRAHQIGWRSRVIKRTFDTVGAIVWLLISMPVIVIAGLCIRAYDRGPMLYRQYRVWKNNRHFWFVKLRTMNLQDCVWYSNTSQSRYDQLIATQNARVWLLPKIKDDPRVTMIGRFLRRMSIDELPSLRCVLMWDMSLVGPRPHLPREVEQYLPWHRQLLTVKPGITGYAQIFGRDQLEFDREAQLELYYIQHRSMWLDLYVLFATCWVVTKWR